MLHSFPPLSSPSFLPVSSVIGRVPKWEEVLAPGAPYMEKEVVVSQQPCRMHCPSYRPGKCQVVLIWCPGWVLLHHTLLLLHHTLLLLHHYCL